LEGQVLIFISSRNRAAQLNSQALSSLLLKLKLSHTIRLNFSLKHLNPTALSRETHTISHVQIERSYRVVLKNMHYSINPEEIKIEIQKLGHMVTTIWIKQCKTKHPLPMFFVELEPAQNNKDIFNVEYIQQCKIKFEPPKHKRDIAQCANCQRYGHTKNYCRLKPRWSNAQVTT
jgi:hypothetical protein